MIHEQRLLASDKGKASGDCESIAIEARLALEQVFLFYQYLRSRKLIETEPFLSQIKFSQKEANNNCFSDSITSSNIETKNFEEIMANSNDRHKNR